MSSNSFSTFVRSSELLENYYFDKCSFREELGWKFIFSGQFRFSSDMLELTLLNVLVSEMPTLK